MTDWARLLDDVLPAGFEAAEGICKYLQLLDKWRRTTNLVATGTRAADLVALHVADALALLPHLGGARRIVDVGSGAGIPGAIIAIASPSRSVTALEPAHKKHAFLAAVRRELHLDSFHPLCERDDQHRARADFRPYDLAISRAAFAVPEWLRRGESLIHEGGRVLAMEGRDQHALPPGAARHPYTLANRHRAIIEWRP